MPFTLRAHLLLLFGIVLMASDADVDSGPERKPERKPGLEPEQTGLKQSRPVLVVDDEEEGGGIGGFLRMAGPAWMLSTLVHTLALIALAFITIAPPTRLVNVLTASPSDEEGPEMEEFEIEVVDPGEVQEFEEMTEPVEQLDQELWRSAGHEQLRSANFRTNLG